jgi:alpha-tubulin suppressor-like RCC1 family protein
MLQTVCKTTDGQLFSIDHKTPNELTSGKSEKDLKMKLLHIRKLTHIVKLAAGRFHFLALKKVVRPAFAEWSSQQVYEWISQTKLDFVMNVIKYSKIDGKTLINAPKEFFSDTLGITDVFQE